MADSRGGAELADLPGWMPGRRGGGTSRSRVDRVIARSRAVHGDIALSARGHVLLPRGIGLSEGGGQQHFLLDTGTLCVLGYYRDILLCGSRTGLSSTRAR